VTASTIAPGELGIEAVADATGRTRVVSLRQRYPQRVTTPLRCHRDHPGAATLCVQSPSGGVFPDDDLRTTVRCEPGSHLHLTTQAATQVFAGDGPGARHRLGFTVAAAAVFEYYPLTVIPHAHASLTQRIDIDIEPGGIYLGWEAVAAGRIAHGERFGYACYDNAFTLRTGGRVVARDRQVIRPESGCVPDCLVDDYLAMFVAVAPGRPQDPLLQSLRAVLDGLTGCYVGAGRLPGDAGVLVRLTARRAPELHRARRILFDQARAQLLVTTNGAAL
jgi:urease accessory protein